MGDYKPEIVYENAEIIREIEPGDEERSCANQSKLNTKIGHCT